MKHLKATSIHNRSFDQLDEHHVHSFSSMPHHSSASLTSFNVSQSHDFELKQREIGSIDRPFYSFRKARKSRLDHPTKKHRFFYKRRTKLPQLLSEENSPNRLKKSSSYLFGQTLDELLHQHDEQLPPVIMVQRKRRAFVKPFSFAFSNC